MVDATSSIRQIVAAYRDNASYEADGDVAKARNFVTACIVLLGMAERERKGAGGAGAEHQFNHEVLERQLNYARQYVAANATTDQLGPAVLDVDFSEFDTRT